MSGYSVDLKERIISAVEEDGMSQGSGCSHLLREPLLGQTLRQQGQKGRIAGSEEEARIYSEARREGNKAPCRRSRRTALPHTSGALRLHRGHDGALCKSLHHVPRHSQDRSYKEKGGRVATERDEFERAAEASGCICRCRETGAR